MRRSRSRSRSSDYKKNYRSDKKLYNSKVKSGSEDETTQYGDVDRFRDEFVRENEQASNAENPPVVEKPNFETSGLLTQEANLKNGVILKYTEPVDSATPTEGWRLYIFKPPEEKPQIVKLRSSSTLVGKEQRVVDVLMPHPSVGRQHATLQFRHSGKVVKLYIIDLESTNGTWLNGERIDSARFYELREQDVLRFGMSSREVVVMRDSAATVQEVDLRQLAAGDIENRRRNLAHEAKRSAERDERKKQDRAALIARYR